MAGRVLPPEDTGGPSSKSLLLTRLIVAVLGAAALYWLTGAAVAPPSWPATAPVLFAPMLLAAIYLPLLAMLGCGKMPVLPLAVWLVGAAIIIAGLGYHDVARGRIADAPWSASSLPRFQLWAALSIGFFVAHALVTDSVIERRWRPSYPLHFDTAWKLGVQIGLAFVFVAVFWGVLELGAGLFNLINIDVFKRLLTKRWFYEPATALALAVAIHVTDVQPALIRGARSLALSLFSWLTPLLALITLGFLSSLPFVSLQPLWHTHFATSLLLAVALMLIFLINCCYQDGAAEQTKSKPKRLTASLGAIELVPLAALAAWALGLRVNQYGWSVQRVTACAVVAVVGCYAIGYATAMLRSPAWLKRLELTNWVTAYVALAVLLALFTPVADPARLMVADQMARLKSGAASPETFDYASLKFDGGRWGMAALNDIRSGPLASNAAVQARVGQVLAANYRYQFQQSINRPPPEEVARDITVLPPGRSLPPVFLDPDFAKRFGLSLDACVPRAAVQTRCVAHYVALSPGAPEAVVLIFGLGASVFEQDAQEQWHRTGFLNGPVSCLLNTLRSEPLTVEPHEKPDIAVGGQRFTILPAVPANPCLPVIGSPLTVTRPN